MDTSYFKKDFISILEIKEIYSKRIEERNKSTNISTIGIDLEDNILESLKNIREEYGLSNEDLVYNIILDSILSHKLKEEKSYIDIIFDSISYQVLKSKKELNFLNYIVLDDTLNNSNQVINNYKKYETFLEDENYKKNYELGFEKGKAISLNEILTNIIKNKEFSERKKIKLMKIVLESKEIS